MAAILLPALARAREAARRSSCQNNLKQLGLVFKMYANESKGELFPSQKKFKKDACERDDGFALFLDGPAIYPEYLTDSSVMVCPSDSDGKQSFDDGRWHMEENPDLPINPCLFDDLSYIYLAWAMLDYLWMTDPSHVNNDPFDLYSEISGPFLLALDDLLSNRLPNEWGDDGDPAPFDDDIKMGDGQTIFRTREGIERFLITDINNPAASAQAQSTIWIMYDEVNSANPSWMNHIPGGCNVLYLDVHVAFSRYPSETPVSRGWAVLQGDLKIDSL